MAVREFDKAPAYNANAFTEAQRGALAEHMAPEDIDGAETDAMRFEAVQRLGAWSVEFDGLRHAPEMAAIFQAVDAVVTATLSPEDASDTEKAEAGTSSTAEDIGAESIAETGEEG